MFDFGSWRKFLVIFFFEGVFWTVDCDKAGFPPVWIINGIQTSLTFKESCSIRGERIDGSSSFSAKISKEKGWGKEWESKRRCSWHGNLAPNVPASWSPISLYLLQLRVRVYLTILAWRGHSVACRLPRHRPPLSLRIPQRRGMGEVAEGTNLTPNGNLTRGRYSLANRTSRPHPPGYQCHLSNFQFY